PCARAGDSRRAGNSRRNQRIRRSDGRSGRAMTSGGLSTSRKGARGEDVAASYLELKGWNVLARNFRTRVGEIDIIARRGDQVAFVEVKSWQSVPREDLARSIGPRKRARIARAARLFLSRRPDLA